MLTADVLNSDATLNNFHVINTLDFIAGSEFTLVIRLKQPQHEEKLRYIPASGATLTLTLPTKNSEALSVTMTALDDDRSIWSGDITAEQSEELATGNCTFDLVEDTKTTKGWIQNALALIVTGSCC